MRGADRQTGKLISYASTGEPGAAGPTVAGDPAAGEHGVGAAVAGIRGDLRGRRTAVDPAGEAVACTAAASPVLDPLGAAAEAADHLQHAVPQVRRATLPAVPHGAWADGEQEPLGGGRDNHDRGGDGGALCRWMHRPLT